MAQQGASLQNYNNELVKCLEDLREKREQINKEISREEDDKNKIQNDLKILTERLSRINDSLARKVAATHSACFLTKYSFTARTLPRVRPTVLEEERARRTCCTPRKPTHATSLEQSMAQS